jgi:hypothetical protein
MNIPQVGDKVVIAGSLRSKRIDTITKVTKTQVTVSSGQRFLLNSSRNVGATQWNRYYYSVVSPEKAAELEREWADAERKADLSRALRNYHWPELGLGTLEAVVKILGIEE